MEWFTLGFEQLWADLSQWYQETGYLILRWLVIGVVGTLVLRYLISTRWMLRLFPSRRNIPYAEQEKRTRTIVGLARGTGVFLLWLVLGGMMLQTLGVSVSALIASFSIFGIAIGLGAQNIVKDLIGGFFILVENHYNVGDVIDIAEVSGRVEDINLRTTILRDIQGRVHVVPNSQITVVTNRTKLWAQVVLDFPIAADEDIDKAIAIIKQVGVDLMQNKTFRSAVLSDPRVLGVHEVTKEEVIIRTVVKTEASKQWSVERIFRKKIKQAFDREGVRIMG